MLKTTSPTWVPEAPKDFARQIDPSSSTSRASATFHGLSPNSETEFFEKNQRQTILFRWKQKNTTLIEIGRKKHICALIDASSEDDRETEWQVTVKRRGLGELNLKHDEN